MTTPGDRRRTYRGLKALVKNLQAMSDKDPEQEVQGMAVPTLDAALVQAKALIGDDPVVLATADIISPETIEAGEPVRAVDALIVAEQLLARLPSPPAYSTRPVGRIGPIG